jgi:CheY-like chemotaxis protein
VACISSDTERGKSDCTSTAAQLTPVPEGVDPTRTILFVDDEPAIRKLAHTVLSTQGFHVILASGGLEALQKYQRYAGRIALVVLDLTMPQMTGQEVFRELRKRYSDTYVLFSSGFSEEPSDQGDGFAGFLAKPYRSQELLGAVREALENKQ